MTYAVKTENLGYDYPDGTRALKGIKFRLGPGESLGLVGAAGSGKSTLAMCLVGLLMPGQGRVEVSGIELCKKNLAGVRRRIGLVFQNPDEQLFMPTVHEDVAFGPAQAGLSGAGLTDRVQKMLVKLGLEKLSAKFPGHLSGGQKKLAALAGVLVMEPDTIVLDEPSANLDPMNRRNLINYLRELKNSRVVIGHDLEMILDLCRRVVVLSGGEIMAEGDAAEVLGDQSLMERACLEVPHSLLSHHKSQTLSRLSSPGHDPH
jgi:cobalt/nickel transport system ATP-binding protein